MGEFQGSYLYLKLPAVLLREGCPLSGRPQRRTSGYHSENPASSLLPGKISRIPEGSLPVSSLQGSSRSELTAFSRPSQSLPKLYFC